MKYCPNCQVSIHDDAIKCPRCGGDLVIKQPQPKKHKNHSFGDAVQIAGAILFIINILSSIVSAIWLFTIPEIWLWGLLSLFGGIFTSIILYILMEAFGELVINSKITKDYIRQIELHIANEHNKK